jgi:hypothetical protein
VFTSPLHRNGSSSIVGSVFVAAGMCLPSRCLGRYVCGGSTIPAFGRHVTMQIHAVGRMQSSGTLKQMVHIEPLGFKGRLEKTA